MKEIRVETSEANKRSACMAVDEGGATECAFEVARRQIVGPRPTVGCAVRLTRGLVRPKIES